jgi:hypothetical protein
LLMPLASWSLCDGRHKLGCKMQRTDAGMIGRQDAPPHAQCAIVKLQSIIVPPDSGIHSGQHNHGISCNGGGGKSKHVKTEENTSPSHTTYFRMILRQHTPP